VCSKHFESNCPPRLSEESGLLYLRKGFCGPSWLSGGRIGDFSESTDESSILGEPSQANPKKACISEIPCELEPGKVSDTGASLTTGFKIEIKDYLDYFPAIVAFLQNIWDTHEDKLIEGCKEYILSSKIGRELMVGGICSVISNMAERMEPFQSRRALVKAAMESFESHDLIVDYKEIASYSGIRCRTIRRAMEEREDVRFSDFSSFSPLD